MPNDTSPDADAVVDNPELQRFELKVGDQVAFAQYRRRPGLLMITHVETPISLRGGGVAARVMKGVLEQARASGTKVAPLCAYADAYIRRHPEYRNLVG
jgi:predicted GNAT family acetyltransferase